MTGWTPRWWRLRRARAAVVLAAKIVESGYEPGSTHEHDPDDLAALRAAVAELRRLEERWAS